MAITRSKTLAHPKKTRAILTILQEKENLFRKTKILSLVIVVLSFVT